MSQNISVAIIGAGASGLMSALLCAKKGLKVDIFEQNEKCGKKILVSGNGRCNISNKNLKPSDYFSNNPSFIEYSLEQFGFSKFEKFINSLGLLLDVKEDGRAYPLSNEAKSVVNILVESAKSLGVTFHTNKKIDSLFELTKNYDKVIVATGSRAASHLGGNSDGEKFALELGHNIVDAYPSLVQLHLNSTIAPKMSGAKVEAEVTLFINGIKEESRIGDTLFTNYGVSGFAILDLSQKASAALLEYSSVDIAINFSPRISVQKISAHLLNFSKSNPNIKIVTALSSIVPLKIAQGIINYLQIDMQETLGSLHTKLSKKIANALTNWKFEVSQTHGFRHAEVSGGGVDTLEINPKTMASYKDSNIYFCGEVLDVVGRRGGFNFAFAWASAYAAAQDITK